MTSNIRTIFQGSHSVEPGGEIMIPKESKKNKNGDAAIIKESTF